MFFVPWEQYSTHKTNKRGILVQTLSTLNKASGAQMKLLPKQKSNSLFVPAEFINCRKEHQFVSYRSPCIVLCSMKVSGGLLSLVKCYNKIYMSAQFWSSISNKVSYTRQPVHISMQIVSNAHQTVY